MGRNKAQEKELICDVCGKTFKRKSYQVQQNKRRKTKKICCSRSCYDEHQRETHGPNWKGGRNYLHGYIRIAVPKERKARGWDFEHRVVMEDFLKKKLTPRQIIHHKNGIKDDNRLENLEVMTLNSHRGKIECPYCEKTFYIR